MNKRETKERKIEFKKNPNIKIRKYDPERAKKLELLSLTKYASYYEFNETDYPPEELFI